jgi:predicted DNA-binding protein YlxM (UPF0122 family)
MIEKKMKMSDLYDFYGKLLTVKQADILELYCNEDLSLGEVATELGITRQAVYDAVKRAEKILDSYEEKLGLMEKFQKQEDIISHVASVLDMISDELDNKNTTNVRLKLKTLKDDINSLEKLQE